VKVAQTKTRFENATTIYNARLVTPTHSAVNSGGGSDRLFVHAEYDILNCFPLSYNCAEMNVVYAYLRGKWIRKTRTRRNGNLARVAVGFRTHDCVILLTYTNTTVEGYQDVEFLSQRSQQYCNHPITTIGICTETAFRLSKTKSQLIHNCELGQHFYILTRHAI